MPNIENIITAKEFSLQDILSNKKYSVDFFQREYSWGKENIIQLVYDLTKMLSKQDTQEFHLSEEIRIKQVTPKMKEYLNYHREKVFKK